MAELGVLASGITVVGLLPRIARGIVDLKDFVESVKNAPKEIHRSLLRVAVLTRMLEEIAAAAAAPKGYFGVDSTDLCLRIAKIPFNS